jgi:hypothetical protein
MLGRSQLTPSHTHVARMLLMHYRYKSDHEWTDLLGRAMSHVLADDDRQMDKSFAMTYKFPPTASMVN